jgi:potassium channel subfamily K protein 13
LFAFVRANEDNVRFALLSVVMVNYMLLGALLFMLIEKPQEIEARAAYTAHFTTFLAHNPSVNLTELDLLLRQYADAAEAGLLDTQRSRWDFAGSFYFVGTVVSTIGKCQKY